MARPTIYTEEYAEKAEDWCGRFPFTYEHLAKALDIHRDTIYEWRKIHPEFSDSILKGKDYYYNPTVEKSLAKRAMGYEYKEITRKPDLETGAMKTVKEVTKQVAPDTGAAIFYLKNRVPGRWRDKIEIQTTGNIQITWDDPNAIDVTPGDVKELTESNTKQLNKEDEPPSEGQTEGENK